jgi:hypothetical protein
MVKWRSQVPMDDGFCSWLKQAVRARFARAVNLSERIQLGPARNVIRIRRISIEERMVHVADTGICQDDPRRC